MASFQGLQSLQRGKRFRAIARINQFSTLILSFFFSQFQVLYENEHKLNAQVQGVTSTKFDAPISPKDADGEPRESFLHRVMSFNGRRTLSESRPNSFVVANHTPQLTDEDSPLPARKSSAGEAIATKFIGTGSFKASRPAAVQEENASSLEIDDSSL